MKRILVAYDGTPGSELAIRDMVRAGFPERAEGRVLTIADVWMPPAPQEDGLLSEHRDQATLHAKANEVLREAKKIAIQGAQMLHGLFPNWIISNLAKADSPAWGIAAEARRWHADLIVIGSHGRSPLERFFLGSVSWKVATEAVCSVRVVRPRDHHTAGTAKILLAIDGSEDSRRAAEAVLEREWPGQPEILALTVVDPKLKTVVLASREFSGSETNIERIEDWIEPVFDKLQTEFSERGLALECRILEGDPKRTLLHESMRWDADCIFLGARGLDHGDRLYLGTLASAICTRANCTVEIVRPKIN